MDIKNTQGTKPVSFDSLKPTKPLPTASQVFSQPKFPAHLPEKNINQVPQKKSILLMWFLNLITFKIYSSFWYLKRSSEFPNLDTQKKLNKKLPLILVITNILLIALIIIFPLTITLDMGIFYQHLSNFQIILLFVIAILILLRVFFSLLVAFYSRTIINQALENKNSKTRASALFTFVFNYLYLQYEINKISDDKEDTPKTGPWVFLLIILILFTLGLVSSLI